MATYTSTNNYIYFKDTSDGHLWTRMTYTLTEDTSANTYTITLTNVGISINGWMDEWHYAGGDFVINGQTISHKGYTAVFTGVSKDDGATFKDMTSCGLAVSSYFSNLTIGPFSYSTYPTITAKQTDRYIKGFGTVGGNPHTVDVTGTTKSGGTLSVPHAHSHSYTSTITKQPTCLSAGVRTYTCACGNKYTESIAATGNHTYSAATCTKPQTCTVCGVTNGSALPHSYVDTVVPPTCVEQGYTKHTCSGCNTSYTDAYIDAIGHNYDGITCVNCGGSLLRPFKHICYVFDGENWVRHYTNIPNNRMNKRRMNYVYRGIDESIGVLGLGKLGTMKLGKGG